MAELPLLFFPKSSTEAPARRGGGGSEIVKPTPAQQRTRLDNKFRTIANSFQDMTSSVEGLEPEQVIVLETIGSVDGLAKACAQIPGLEWLTEVDLEEDDPGDGFEDKEEPTNKLPRRLYAVMSNQQAMESLIALWNNWLKHPKERAQQKYGPFKNIFILLKDIRRWSVQDRISETRVVEYWEERLEDERDNIRFEVELWYRGDDARRRIAYQNLRQLIVAAGGQCLSNAPIPEILYYGVLAELPAVKVRETIDRIMDTKYTQLLTCQDVMFFRPHAQSLFPVSPPEEKPTQPKPAPTKKAKLTLPKGPPTVALLDGLPLERHDALDGRLVIDDPDDHASHYTTTRQQEHGTAMASLIVHGDLSTGGEALSRPVYVRPILVPYEDLRKNVYEKIPDTSLIVDLVHRAVIGIKGTDNTLGTAPSVKVINMSIGNSWQPFVRELSPLARLLDWLAWKYKILFVVSVGNQNQTIAPALATSDLGTVSDESLRDHTLRAIRGDQVHRRPFSPSEAINVLTVGALHTDGSTWSGGDRRIDLLKDARLPSPTGTVASGFNRAVKPDIYFPGGRQLYVQHPSTELPPRFNIANSTRPPGIRVAAPGELPMELGRTVHSRGSSNATALATRTSALIYERLLALKGEPGGELLTDEYVSVMLKTLLVHGASWGAAADMIETVFGRTELDWREMMRLKSRFLGYGEVNPQRALFSEDKRVLMLGWDTLGCDEAHDYSVPLPPALSGQKVKRRLTVTLAWFSPLNPKHKDYRKALLWFTPENKKLALDKKDLDADGSRRGTVQHQIFEGEKTRGFADGDKLVVKVSCADDAGKLTERIPYSLAVTLEVADPANIKIFNEVKDRIRLKVGVRPKAT